MDNNEGHAPTEQAEQAVKPDFVIGSGEICQRISVTVNSAEQHSKLLEMLGRLMAEDEPEEEEGDSSNADIVPQNTTYSAVGILEPVEDLVQELESLEQSLKQDIKEEEDEEPLIDEAQFSLPGEFTLDPPRKFVFRGPYDVKQAKTLKIFNKSEREIAFKIDAFSRGKIELSNTIGIIKPGEFTRIEVRTMSLRKTPEEKDRIQVDVVNVPEGKTAAEGLWFWRDGTRTRKSVMIQYLK